MYLPPSFLLPVGRLSHLFLSGHCLIPTVLKGPGSSSSGRPGVTYLSPAPWEISFKLDMSLDILSEN